MKHLFLTIILNTCCILVFAQNFIDTSKVWSVASFGFDGSNWMPPKSKYLQFKGDTLIDNRIYAKLCSSDNREKQGWRIRSFMREETDGKVYTRFTGGYEFLCYDFNLQINDDYYRDGYLELRVDSISIKPFGNRNLKYIFLSTPEEPSIATIWIEGVGAWNSTPDESCPFMLAGGVDKLICFEEQGELIYHNTTYSGCFINSAESIQNSDELVRVFSPGSEWIVVQIHAPDTQPGTFSLYTPIGKRILKCPLTAPETTLCAPGTGLYLYRFVSEKGGVQSGKVVVE